MSTVVQIKNKIYQLGPGEFQNFCDELLTKMDQYGRIVSLGMKAGTNKTTKGTPDTYFVRNDGKYVLAEYTTKKDPIYEKLKADIEKCLDPKNTGLEMNDINEIICCHTSSNLSAGDDKKLRKICHLCGWN